MHISLARERYKQQNSSHEIEHTAESVSSVKVDKSGAAAAGFNAIL